MIAYRLSHEWGLTVSVWDGRVTADESLRYLLEVADDMDWPPGRLGLVDMRTVREFAPADRDVAFELLDGSGKAGMVRRVAVLARPVPGDRRNGIRNDLGLKAERFDDVESACAFLGVPTEVAMKLLAETRADLER